MRIKVIHVFLNKSLHWWFAQETKRIIKIVIRRRKSQRFCWINSHAHKHYLLNRFTYFVDCSSRRWWANCFFSMGNLGMSKTWSTSTTSCSVEFVRWSKWLLLVSSLSNDDFGSTLVLEARIIFTGGSNELTLLKWGLIHVPLVLDACTPTVQEKKTKHDITTCTRLIQSKLRHDKGCERERHKMLFLIKPKPNKSNVIYKKK